MDIKELRKMTLPKLREHAKQVSDLQGIVGMKKEELIELIAKAEGVAYAAPAKDVSTIKDAKQEIQELRKKRDELLASSKDHAELEKLRKRIKTLKRLTRKIAEKGTAKATQTPPPAT
ncbi:MAG: Rho termination factor N-terminal domain-containing protein [Deltaproteobacteria bacterium]|nr:Rho termination factor N-terminal domain-containing protein [Deltaproteobacteria bacterium]